MSARDPVAPRSQVTRHFANRVTLYLARLFLTWPPQSLYAASIAIGTLCGRAPPLQDPTASSHMYLLMISHQHRPQQKTNSTHFAYYHS